MSQDAMIRKMQMLFDQKPEGISEKLMRGVEVQRTRTIKAGKLLFCDCYPVWSLETSKTAKEIMAKREQSEGSSEKQQRLNAWHSQRKLEMLINENFTDGDLLVTLTYLPEEMPATWQEAKKDRCNFIRRVRDDAKKRKAEMWYVAVMEESHTRHGVRYHHHVTIHCPGLTRERAEEIWGRKHKGWANTKAAKVQREGLRAWAKYISKEIGSNAKGQTIPTDKRWYASQGMKRPWEKATVSNSRMSRATVRRVVEEIAREQKDGSMETARAALEKAYPGFELIEVNARVCDEVAGAYLYAVMCRRR